MSRRATVVSFLSLAVLAPCGAQDQVTFDPGRDLEGFTACEDGAHPDVFDLGRFWREKGKKVTAARLEELRVLWRAERERGNARLAKIARDPRQLALLKVEQKLRRDPFFRELVWTVEDEHLPYAFLLQRSGVTDTGPRITMTRVLPYLQAAAERLARDVLQPAGITASDAQRLQPVLVLTSGGNYADCMKLHHSAGFYTTEACWVRAFDTLVVFRDPTWSQQQAANALRMAQFELGVATLRKLCTAPAGWRAWWLLTGVAAYTGRAGAPGLAGAPDATLYHPEWVKTLATTLVSAEQRRFTAPLLELAAVPDADFAAIGAGAQARGARAANDRELESLAYRVHYQQCALWCCFLLTQRGPAFTRCVQKALQGGSGLEALHAGFPAAELPALEAAFGAWLRAEHAKAAPGVAVPDPLPLPAPTPSAPAGSAPAPLALPAASAEPVVAPAETLAALAITPLDWQLVVAVAIADARAGALGRAAAALAACQAPANDATAQARLQGARARVAALLEVRTRLIALHADGKKILDLDFGSKRVRGRVEKVTDTHVSVRAGKDLEQVALDTLEPAKLDLVARRLGVLDAKAWQSAYLQFLADGAADKLKRKLAAGDDASKALLGDLESYAAFAALVEPGRLLLDVVQGADGAPGLAAVEKLVRTHGALPAVQTRKRALRQRAQALLAAVFDPYTSDGLGVHAKVERVGDATVRVRYDAKDKAQVQDFTPDADYLKHWKFDDLSPGGAPKIELTDGAFALTGRGVLRLPFALTSPMKIEWRVAWPEGTYCALCVCDDARGSLLSVGPGGAIELVDDAPNNRRVESEFKTYVDTEYAVVASHDGTALVTTVDGSAAARLGSVGKRKGGRVLLFVYGAEPTRVQGLTIEGSIDPATIEPLRQRYVARRLVEIFGS